MPMFLYFFFQLLLSAPSYQTYDTLEAPDSSTWLVYFGEWTMKYISQYLPYQNKVSLSLCQLCDIYCAVHDCTGGDVQSSNKKMSLLTWFKLIYVCWAVHYSPQIDINITNIKIYLLKWWWVSKIKHNMLIRRNFTFDWTPELLHPKWPILPCSS